MISPFVVFGFLKFPSGGCPVRGEGSNGVISHSVLWPLSVLRHPLLRPLVFILPTAHCQLDFGGRIYGEAAGFSPGGESEAVFLWV
jgi:hypothetical protein